MLLIPPRYEVEFFQTRSPSAQLAFTFIILLIFIFFYFLAHNLDSKDEIKPTHTKHPN